jgi:hypothetical protein
MPENADTVLVRYGEGDGGPMVRRKMEDVPRHNVERAVENSALEGSP